MRVVFLERSGAGLRRIAVSRGGRGSARFRAAVAPGLRRRVVALVARAGLPESRQTVARFRARTPEPGRPARVTIRRRGGGVVIRWTRARRSTGHLVRVRVSDGRTLLFQPRRGRRLRVGEVARRDRATVSVERACGQRGPNGPGGRLHGCAAEPLESPFSTRT